MNLFQQWLFQSINSQLQALLLIAGDINSTAEQAKAHMDIGAYTQGQSLIATLPGKLTDADSICGWLDTMNNMAPRG